MLGGLPWFHDERVLVGRENAEDAGVYRVSDDLALVQTVDFFTPIVDDPYDFGRVAAANALSDIYAMGAVPMTALNIVGFPVDKLDLSVLHEILRGAADKCVEAEVAVMGGHSIDDVEPKFGMAVTGRVHPERLLRNTGARPGDRLVLTKPLGTGILATALKQGKLTAEEAREMVELMATLNRGAGEAALEVGVHGATDVTGFGLLGHLYEMASGSGLEAEIWMDRVPLLLEDRLRSLGRDGVVPGGSRKNLRFIRDCAEFDPALAAEEPQILADAQTSGGLLLAVAPERVEALLDALGGKETPAAAVVGRMGEGCAGTIRVLPGMPA